LDELAIREKRQRAEEEAAYDERAQLKRMRFTDAEVDTINIILEGPQMRGAELDSKRTRAALEPCIPPMETRAFVTQQQFYNERAPAFDPIPQWLRTVCLGRESFTNVILRFNVPGGPRYLLFLFAKQQPYQANFLELEEVECPEPILNLRSSVVLASRGPPRHSFRVVVEDQYVKEYMLASAGDTEIDVIQMSWFGKDNYVFADMAPVPLVDFAAGLQLAQEKPPSRKKKAMDDDDAIVVLVKKGVHLDIPWMAKAMEEQLLGKNPLPRNARSRTTMICWMMIK
jgi:hypothetical protein